MGDRGQLRFLGAQGRDAAAVGGAMIERARGREAERPGAQAFAGELGHAPAVLLGGGLAVGAALAHHIDAQGGMRHLGGDIDIVGTVGDGIEEIREAVPVPRQAFAQHDFGNVFHAFHQVYEHVVLVFVARREADAAIAEQHGRRPVPGRRRQPVAPGHLRVVVRVHVDEARRYKLAARVDLLGALGQCLRRSPRSCRRPPRDRLHRGLRRSHRRWCRCESPGWERTCGGSSAGASIVPAGEQSWQTGRRSCRAHVACATRMCHCRPERSEGPHRRLPRHEILRFAQDDRRV